MKMNFSKILLLATLMLFVTITVIKAQSTAAGGVNPNNFVASPIRFLGWGTTSGNLEFRVNNSTKMLLQNTTGRIGINTTAPLQKLHVAGNVLINGPTSSLFFGESLTTPVNGEWGIEYDSGGLNFWKPWLSNNFGNFFFFLKDNGNVGVSTNNPTARFTVNGTMLIGDASVTLPAGYKLYVQTGVLTEKVKVAVANLADWSDYVFSENYQLRSIPELEAFVKENKHLPNVPSAQQVSEEGIDTAKMDAILLEKIEELSLYVIQLKKRNADLLKRVEKIENN